MITYLVTGATGVLGSAIVPLLLRQNAAVPYLLMRAETQQHLAERLKALTDFWRHADPYATTTNRIKIARGDVTQPDLGMRPDDYRELLRQCTHIIHCAADVRMNLPLEEARRISVNSARYLIRFAEACPRLSKIEFISTVGVGGRMRAPLSEDWLTHARLFHNTYEAAKAEAEIHVREAVQRGLPITVHRPSMIVGDSDTGVIPRFQVFYHLCEFLSGRRTRGLYPELGQTCLDLIPRDLVAHAVIWSSTNEGLIGRVLHLCSGPSGAIPLVDLREQVRQSFAANGYSPPKMTTVPPSLFRLMLRVIRPFAPARAKRALDTLPLFLDYLAEPQQFENAHTTRLLEQAGIALPSVREYLAPVLRYYLSRARAA